MKLSDMEVDANAIEAGDWVNKIPEMGDLRLKVRGFGNTDDLRLQKDLIEAVPRHDRVGGLSAKASIEVMNKRLEALVLDWAGVIGDDDQPLPFDKDLVAKMLANPKFVRFRDAVIYAASIVGEQRAANEALAVKN